MSAGARGRVLIVDDVAYMRSLLASYAIQAGFEVVGEADRGKVAIRRFQSLRPDGVLLDVALPDLDGLKVAKVLKRLDPEVRIVLVTAAASFDVVQGARGVGAVDVVAKPWEEVRLHSALDKLAGPRNEAQRHE